MVVTAGVQFLRDGMRVRLPGERAQTGSSAERSTSSVRVETPSVGA